MPIKIDKDKMSSRIVRNAIKNQVGERTIDLIQDSIQVYQDEGLSFFQKVWNITKRLAGSLSKFFMGEWSFRSAFSHLISAYLQFTNFDFNQSDAEINNQIAANNLAMHSLTGGFLGSTAGWVASIAVGSSLAQSIPFIGGSMLKSMVLQDILPEAVEETIGNFKSWFHSMMELSLKNDMLWAYKNLRSLIKRGGGLLEKMVGANVVTKLLDQWGHPQGGVATISNGVQWVLEQIPSQGIQSAAEEFLEEFQESFIEGGFIVASTFDTAWQLMLAEKYNREDSIRQIMVYPDKRNRDEKLLIVGEQESIKTSITNSLATYDIVDGADIGLLVGEPLKDFYRKNPLTRQLTIQFREKPNKPFTMEDGSRARTWCYKVPDPKTSLNWRKVKTAAKQFTWGPYRASALLKNRNKMVIWGGSANDAVDKLKELMELSNTEIQKISVSYDKEINPSLRKEPVVAYPYKAIFLYRKGNIDDTGLTDLDGNNYERISDSMYLWPDEEPEKVIDFTGDPSQVN